MRRRARCIICGDPRIHAKDRCKTDYQYLRRNGIDRPIELVIRHNQRVDDRAVAQDDRDHAAPWVIPASHNPAGRTRTGVRHWRKKT